MTNLNNLFDLTKLCSEKDALLVAVSKTKPLEAIKEAYANGQRAFGENKVQELVDKYENLPKDIEWHMIGHLQRNKVKFIAPFVHMIHAVDSLRLAQEIDKQGNRNDRRIKILLQIHIAEESSKFGFDFNELNKLLMTNEIQALPNIEICGIMGMATFTDDNNQISYEFAQLKNYFNQLKGSYFKNDNNFKEISMGMSGDYKIALENGSTMIRVGSAIFGSR